MRTNKGGSESTNSEEFGQFGILGSSLVESLGIQRVTQSHSLNLTLDLGGDYWRWEVEP